MSKGRKRTWQSKGNKWPVLTLTGKSWLKHYDEEIVPAPGDLLVYLFKDTLGREEDEPGYDFLGGSGYLKARIYDGKEWLPVVMDDLFPGKEHHFHKREMPFDTWRRMHGHVATLAGTKMQRIYREHYEPVPE